MRMHFERNQANREAELRIKEQVAENRREGIMRLDKHLQMLPTKASDLENNRIDVEFDSQIQMNELLRELESTQRRILLTHQLKESISTKKAISLAQGGIKGRVGNALANLTMFTREASDDAAEVKLQLEAARDDLSALDRTISRQEHRMEELQ